MLLGRGSMFKVQIADMGLLEYSGLRLRKPSLPPRRILTWIIQIPTLHRQS
jgi:hypothetical protein